MQLMAMGIYLALGDSISIHRHGLASSESWFVQVIEPNLAGATAIAVHWHKLLTSR